MSHRKMTPKGQMSSSGSGPAIMMMPPHIRATFMPNPPLRYLPTPKKGGRCKRRSMFGGNAHLILDDVKKEGKIIKKEQEEEEEDDEELFGHSNNNQGQNKNKHNSNNEQKQYVKNSSLTGVASLMIQFERTPAPKRKVGMTPKIAIVQKNKKKKQENTDKLKPLIDLQLEQIKEAKGEFEGMNCYNTLFVGRLAYETTERKLLREFEVFGPVNNLKLVTVKEDDNQSNSSETGKSRGYAFVEFEREEDMKRAYRGADGMKLDGRAIVVDVERGHTVPNWLPRRLGGGLGGTRLGGKDKNITAPGRFDPSKAAQAQAQANQMMMNNHHNMMGGPPPNYHHPMGMQHGGGGGYGQRPPYGGGYQGGPPPPHHYHGGGGPRGGGGGGPTNEYYGRGPPNNNDRYGGGPGYSSYGRGGPPPPPSSYHNHRGGGRYGNGGSDRYGDRNDRYGSSNSRGPPPPPSSSGRSSSYGMGGGDSNRRRRSRSRSPSSSRDSKRRYRG